MSNLKDSQHLKIPFKDIEIATKYFTECIGKGGYGTVYKGELTFLGQSTTVAVKRLNEQFGQGLKEFLMEIQLLSGQKHPNLITLIGYCDEGKEKIIVYEYAENGSLDRYLKRRGNVDSLTWVKRLKICVDAARGLNHLHNHAGKHQAIIHRDMKSSNILLDENWNAKISDLGLSKLYSSGLNKSLVISHACGTQGYVEPEYVLTNIVTKESDVYSFGMVLFEVLCGRLCLTKVNDDDGFVLSDPLVKDYYRKNKMGEIVDPSLKGQMSVDCMNKFSTIAYRCLLDRGNRSPMDLIVKQLGELMEIQSSSYVLESPRKIRAEMGTHVPDSSSSEPSAMSSMENQHISKDVNNINGSGAELKAVNSTDMEIDLNSLLFDSMLSDSLHLTINPELVKMVLDTKRGIWRNHEFFDLVEDYFNTNLHTLDFCSALEKCLHMVRDTRVLILETLQHFDQDYMYEKTLENLKNFEAIGDIFTEEFFTFFNSRYRDQGTFLEKLQTRKMNLDQPLSKKWTINSLFKNKKKAFEGQREVISSMQVSTVITIKELDMIRFLVNKLQMDIQNLTKNAEFAIKNDEAMKYVIKDIKEKVDSFSRDAVELGTKVKNCAETIQSARGTTVMKIIELPSDH